MGSQIFIVRANAIFSKKLTDFTNCLAQRQRLVRLLSRLFHIPFPYQPESHSLV